MDRVDALIVEPLVRRATCAADVTLALREVGECGGGLLMLVGDTSSMLVTVPCAVVAK